MRIIIDSKRKPAYRFGFFNVKNIVRKIRGIWGWFSMLICDILIMFPTKHSLNFTVLTHKFTLIAYSKSPVFLAGIKMTMHV